MCGLGDAERRDNSLESLCSYSILARHLGEAGRNTEGRVIRRLSRWGRKEVKAAEEGTRHLQPLWMAISQMCRPYGEDGLEVEGE